MIRIGCCAEASDYVLVRDAGYDAIELPGKQIAALTSEAFRELEHLVRAGGLPCCGFNAAFPPEIRVCGPNYNLKTAREYMKILCLRGAALGGAAIGVGSPASRTLPDGFEMALAWEQARSFLAALCQEAALYDINILWESLNPTETNFGLSMPEAAEKIQELRRDGLENLWLVADFYHMSMVGENPQVLIDCLPLVRHLHIAQRVGSQRRYPSLEYAKDYQQLLRPVIASGYSGVISMEAFDGRIAVEGTAALKLLRQLIGDCKTVKYKK